MFATYRRINEKLIFCSNWVVVVLTAGMVAAVTLQVFSRVLFQHSMPWTEEVARYLSIWITGIAASIAFRYGEHVGVEFLVNLLPFKCKKAVRIIGYLAICYFLIRFAHVSLDQALKNMNQLTPVLRIPMGLVKISIPIGSIVMINYGIETMLMDFYDLYRKKKDRPSGERSEDTAL